MFRQKRNDEPILLNLRVQLLEWVDLSEEAVKGVDPAWVAGDAIVQSEHHHAAPMRALVVQLIELIAQRLLVGGSLEILSNASASDCPKEAR